MADGRWRDDPSEMPDVSEKITVEIENQSCSSLTGKWDPKLVQRGYKSFSRTFDEHFGGFGDAPKFPTPHNLSFLMAYSDLHKEKHALAMAEKLTVISLPATRLTGRPRSETMLYSMGLFAPHSSLTCLTHRFT